MAIIRNIMAVVIGFVIGSVVNMAIIELGASLLPPPLGVDASSMESLAASMHLFEPKHYLTPFIAHAVGTLIGAFIAYLIAASHQQKMAYLVAAIFLLGGIMMASIIPAPAWFMLIDILAAYLPMAWIGSQIARKIKA